MKNRRTRRNDRKAERIRLKGRAIYNELFHEFFIRVMAGDQFPLSYSAILRHYSEIYEQKISALATSSGVPLDPKHFYNQLSR